MKAVIADDEFYAIQGLKMLLEEIDGIDVVATFEESSKLLTEIEDIRPDVLFLDIEMPQLNGFQVLERLTEINCIPNIIFVTAYTHYAVKAFEVNAIDYIVKPVVKSRLLKAIERIKPITEISCKNVIEINCFKQFRILDNKKDINSGWRTRKAEELIAYLISENGSYVSKDKIAEALWPDQNRENALSNLYMAYYYIKRQEEKLGIKIPIESKRGKMRIDIEKISCDLIEFNKLIEQGYSASQEKMLLCLEKAAQLYQGTVFEDRYFSWATTIQSYYEIRYVDLLEKLIFQYRKQNNEQRTIFYEDILKNI